MKFVLVDESTSVGNAAQFGGPITPGVLVQKATALDTYLNRDVATYWGGAYAVRAGSNAKDVQPGEIVCALVDLLPAAPGAVAYHDVTGAEVPVVFLARTQCNNLTSGPDSVSSALAHELAETAGDAFCNAWRLNSDGKLYAQELCDAVQEANYEIGGITVSDFVLPAFFAPGATGPMDYLATIGTGAVTAPFQTMSGGYQLVRDLDGSETQVTGMISAHRAAKKAHWSSRTYRRGARIIVPTAVGGAS
jgi:hypothetical protein